MSKRKLLDAIQDLSVNNLTELESISMCVSDRLSWLELREPDYDSSEWNDKYDMLSDAADALEEALGKEFCDISEDEIPEEFKTDEWWRKRGL